MTEVTLKVRCLTIVSRSSYVSKVYFDKKADESMMRVLIIITTSFAPWDGLTTVAMNYYRRMDKSGLQINFASCNEAPQSLVDELKQNSSQYIQLPDRKKKTLGYMKALYLLLKKGKYDVVHIHGNSATMTFDLLPSWLLRVKKRIVHVHNVRNNHPFIHNIMKPLLNCLVTDRIAVSEEAGRYLYGEKNFFILNNAIDVDRYPFEQQSRSKCRKEWGISDSAFVIGMVGRMDYQKNQKFIVKIFSYILHSVQDAMLIIVGDGRLREELESQIRALGIARSCILTGMQENVVPFLSAMDVFVFPSIYEGFGLALLEAQANGLPCIASASIPYAANATNTVSYIDLQEPEKWIKKIKEVKKHICEEREEKSKSNIAAIRAKGYDIIQQSGRLEKLYNKTKD